MALLTVRLYGDPVLRQVAAPVAEVTPEIQRIIADMTETMWHQVGIGLAAPQVGLPYRILVMDDGKGGAQALLNPVIDRRAGTSGRDGQRRAPPEPSTRRSPVQARWV